MYRRPECEYSFGEFRKFEIFRDKELGHGSYGAVYKAKCDALPCAAKLIYPVLFASNVSQQAVPSQGKDHRQPMQRFEEECHFLSRIKHPNIVQYLGVYRDTETNVPVLLMELMDESLTHFLETSHKPLLYHIQLNILHDTALALAFLHSNGITHRDMSSNNVLLLAGSRAKVTDFGMSKFADTPHLTSMTQCPGTPAYMSPEALDEPPVYSNKLDCFSFGVLIIQVITREFPKPTDRFQTMELAHPKQPSRRYQARVLVPEMDRRQYQINLIPTAHPLRPIALDCIKDSDIERPTTDRMCETLEQLKTTTLYASSLQQVFDKELLLTTQSQTIKTNQKQLHELRMIIQDKDQQIYDKDRLIQDNAQQLQHQQQQFQNMQQENEQLRKLLQLKNQQITKLQRVTPQRAHVHEQTLTGHTQDLQPQLLEDQLKDKKKRELKQSWKKGPKAPVAMYRGSSTMIGNTVYFNHFNSQDVYAFNFNTTQWSTLPQCPYRNTTLSTINNKLTSVGGMDLDGPTNKLNTHHDQKWVELYSPMPTERRWAAVLSTTTHIAVIGGLGRYGRRLDTTEVLHIESKQWNTASPLPCEMYLAAATLCGDLLYLTGGSNNDYCVLSCSFSDLVQSTRISKQKQSSSSAAFSKHSNVWHNICDLPVRHTTCVTVQGKVLAIGGIDQHDKKSTAVYELNMDNNEWAQKGYMNIARSQCLATALPDNSIFVVGGESGISAYSGEYTDETEFATCIF